MAARGNGPRNCLILRFIRTMAATTMTRRWSAWLRVGGASGARASTTWINVVALATEGAQVGQQSSVAGKLGALVIPRGMSPPVDSPSSPVKGHRRRQPLPENRVMMERRLANIGQPIGGLSTVDPDLEAWREDLQRRRVDAAKIGLQLTRRLPDLDLKPVWLDDVEGNQLAMYDQLATAGRARS